ncbi:MAG: hypothetical protein QW794_00070 [Thermosphaera sp.]
MKVVKMGERGKKGKESERWSWVRIPKPVYMDLKQRAEREKIAMWKLLIRAFNYWRSTQLEHHQSHPQIDKAAWYTYKLSSSVGELRGNPTKENLEKLMVTCRQINERLKVDVDALLYAAQQYVSNPNSKNRMVLNDAAKAVVLSILFAFSTHSQEHPSFEHASQPHKAAD